MMNDTQNSMPLKKKKTKSVAKRQANNSRHEKGKRKKNDSPPEVGGRAIAGYVEAGSVEYQDLKQGKARRLKKRTDSHQKSVLK